MGKGAFVLSEFVLKSVFRRFVISRKKSYVEQINSNDNNKESYNVFRKLCKAKNSDVR